MEEKSRIRIEVEVEVDSDWILKLVLSINMLTIMKMRSTHRPYQLCLT